MGTVNINLLKTKGMDVGVRVDIGKLRNSITEKGVMEARRIIIEAGGKIGEDGKILWGCKETKKALEMFKSEDVLKRLGLTKEQMLLCFFYMLMEMNEGEEKGEEKQK